MAITISDTSWSGKAASPMITKAATSFASTEKGVLYVADSVRKTLTIPRFDISNLFQNRAATPVSQGTGTVSGRTITPSDMMVYWEFNPRDFETHFEAENLTDALLKREIPAELLTAIQGSIERAIAQQMDFQVWRSRTTNTDANRFYSGLIKKMLDDSDVIDVASAVTLTAANIEAKLTAVKELIPDAIYEHPDFKYLVNVKTAKFWADAQRAAGYKGVNMGEGGVTTFDGRPVVSLPGLHDDTIVGTYCSNTPASNLWFGVNSMKDNLVQFDFLQANSELMFFKMLFKGDVQYGWGSEIVLYTTQTA